MKKRIEIRIGICEMLLIVFIILKLCGVIDWSWWWVVSPLYVAFIYSVFKAIKDYKKKETLAKEEAVKQQILNSLTPEQREHITDIKVKL